MHHVIIEYERGQSKNFWCLYNGEHVLPQHQANMIQIFLASHHEIEKLITNSKMIMLSISGYSIALDWFAYVMLFILLGPICVFEFE